MRKNFLITGALFGGLAVALGAFGAHGLQRITEDEKILHGFQTGVQYQVYHALALLAVGLLYDKISTKQILWAGYCFVTGILFFSGSLYLITILKINGSSFTKFIGPLTPLGGVLFIIGWVLLFFSFKKGF